MKNQVFWKNPRYSFHPHLANDIQCDYLIVGGGVVGVSMAYFLVSLGAENIALIERDVIASGATGRAAGNFVHGMEAANYWHFIERYGIHKVRIYWNEQINFLDKVQKIIKKERVDCDFHLGHYYVLGRNANKKDVLKEYSIRKKFKERVSLLQKEDIVREIGTSFFDIGEKLKKVPLINPLKFTQNLSYVLTKYGVHVYEKTPLVFVNNNTAHTPRGKIIFKTIIHAVDSFARSRSLNAVQTSIIVTKPLSQEELSKYNLLAPFAFEDCEARSYNYGRFLPDGRILVGGGDILLRTESKRFSLHLPHINYLKKYLHRIFPVLDTKIEYAWTGTVGSPKSLLPIVSLQKNRYSIGGGGTQICSMAIGEYVANHVLGKPHPLDKVFGVNKT